MSQLLKKQFGCNFCNRTAEHPERWFKVISMPALVYGNQKPARMVDLEERCNTHACNSCGWMIHRFLNILGIKHDFSSVPMDGEPWTWGRILIP